MLSFDFAKISSSINEKNRDKIPEKRMLRKKPPTVKNDMASPAIRKLKTRIPRMSENEAS
jgi:hypothetical protein